MKRRRFLRRLLTLVAGIVSIPPVAVGAGIAAVACAVGLSLVHAGLAVFCKLDPVEPVA